MINIMSPITTSIRTITRMSAKMVAEHYYGTALYSAVDNSCKVVAADPLSFIPFRRDELDAVVRSDEVGGRSHS